MTNASRYPVRFLIPEAGHLLVRFLVLVQPFQLWLSAETGVPSSGTSEYLWHDGTAVWTEDRMTRVLVSHST